MYVAPHNSLHNVTHHITLKLTQDNYPLWKVVVVPFLEDHDHIGFVDGAHPQPSKLTTDSTSRLLVANLDYQTWYHQNKLLMSALISTLFDNLLPHVVSISTSHSLWLTLEKLFSSHSQAQLMQVQHQLATLKKGAKPIADYFQKAQGFTHMLAAIGHPF